ncbi:hypothetical protein AMTRI_Chr03g143060 [Amborella trichopoda]
MKVAFEYTTHGCHWVSAMRTIFLFFSRFQEDLLLDSQSSFNSEGIISCGSINGKSIILSSSWLYTMPSPCNAKGPQTVTYGFRNEAKTLKMKMVFAIPLLKVPHK